MPACGRSYCRSVAYGRSRRSPDVRLPPCTKIDGRNGVGDFVGSACTGRAIATSPRRADRECLLGREDRCERCRVLIAERRALQRRQRLSGMRASGAEWIDVSSWRSRRLHNATDCRDNAIEVLRFLRELLLARGGDRVVARATLRRRELPLGPHPALHFHHLKRRVERAFLHAKHVLRQPLDVLGDARSRASCPRRAS